MNKKKLIEHMVEFLEEEVSELSESFKSAGSENERNEISLKINEIKKLILMYQFLPVREYGVEDVICPAGLVELESNGRHAFYFIVPKGGGLVTSFEGKAVQMITPHSPLGDALLGKRVGESISITTSGAVTKNFKIVSYY